MAELQRMVSGKIGGKLVFIHTQRYDAPSGKVGKIFVATLSVEINGVRYRKWNSKKVIVFQ